MSFDRNDPAVRAVSALAITAVAVGVAVFAFPGSLAKLVTAVHVIAVISWMAGMLYLPRLFIYHVDAPKGSQMSETFKVMERRLLRIIINPAMIVTWVTGVWLAWTLGSWMSVWFLVKLVAVIAMSAAHGKFSKAVRLFGADENTVSAGRWRLLNEVPTVLMIIIVIMVIVRPFNWQWYPF